jgi:hypothetical protein
MGQEVGKIPKTTFWGCTRKVDPMEIPCTFGWSGGGTEEEGGKKLRHIPGTTYSGPPGITKAEFWGCYVSFLNLWPLDLGAAVLFKEKDTWVCISNQFRLRPNLCHLVTSLRLSFSSVK